MVFEHGEHFDNRKPLFISGSELLAQDIKINYLIHGIIETDTCGQLFGSPGTGKTFIALHMALCVAMGEPWNGRKVKQGLVMYFCAEGRAGIRRRIKAWCIEHDKCNEDFSSIHITRKTIDFGLSNEENIIESINDVSRNGTLPVAFIVIDTLARHMPSGTDENSTKDMNVIIRVVDKIRETLSDCVIMFVHHSGHNAKNRPRGASALTGAMDFEMCCQEGELSFTKMKDAEEPAPIGYKLRSVIIGESDEGEEMSSAVVDYGEMFKNKQTGICSASEKLGINVLIESCAKTQKQISDKWACNEDLWRQDFYEHKRKSDAHVIQNALKQAYNRTKKSLVKKSYLLITGDSVVLLRDEHQQNINDRISQLQTVHGT